MGGHHGRGGPIMMGGEKPKNFKASVKKLLKYLSPFKWKLLLVAFCSAAATVFTIVSPKIFGEVTNELVKGVLSKSRGIRRHQLRLYRTNDAPFTGTVYPQYAVFLPPGLYHGKHIHDDRV
jgi:ABC-type multidrug transport system fused ATPase/permease subunit